MKKVSLKDIVILVLVIVAGVWLFRKMSSLPSLSGLFSPKPVVIDKTPILIKEIRSLEQLITITSYDEVVADSIVYSKSAGVADAFNNILHVPLFPSLQKRLVIIAKGKVLAGADLKQLSVNSILIRNDTVHLQLPKAVILDAILNPSDFETFDETGTWSDEAVIAVKMKARSIIINRALERNILGKAEARTIAVMENLLKNAGFKTVFVQ